MRFALFILLNAVLFIRPAEIVPSLENASIYEAVILVCLLVSATAIVPQFEQRNLVRQPLLLCVFGILVMVSLSHIARGSFSGAFTQGVAFLKIVLYYLLLVAVVDTPSKLRLFLGWVAVLILALTTLTLLEHHGVIDLPALAAYQQGDIDPETGEYFTFPRLCGMGIFNDPNDLSVILVVGMMICLSRLSEKGAARFVWLAALGMMGYALTLTHSRGGFLALVAAIASLFVGRFGLRKTALFGGPVLVALIVVFGGRQTRIDLDNKDDTSQQRINLWHDGLILLKQSPLFGIGANRYEEECGLVAHNSFIHVYTELGILGGTFFMIAFIGPLRVLHNIAPHESEFHPILRSLRPCIMACQAGLVAGMMSLSRNYTLPPYLLLGVVTVYFGMLARTHPHLFPHLNQRLVGRVLIYSAIFIFCADVIVRYFAT